MKKQFSIPAVLASTVLMIAASTIQAGAAPLATIIADPPRQATISITPASGQVALNEVVSISVDFPSSGTGYSNSPLLTLEHDGGTGVWTQVAGQIDKVSASAGTYTFSYPVPVTEKVRVVAKDTPTYATVTSPEKQLTVVPSNGVLDPPSADGKTFTAHFTPAVKDKVTQLQVQRIYTKETNETDAVDPNASPKVGPWETIVSSKQNATGDTTFTVSDPLEVKHKYRAVSGATSNIVEFAAPLPTSNPYGISTGLSQLHFNTYEGDSVNTRTHYFEGEFSMTASSKVPACQPVATMKNSVMKGRGNYSWSFAKKSFTLKIDKATDLCGLGVSKKYALVANHYDKSLLRNTLAGYVGSKFTNLAWTPKSAPVDLFVNGSYRGSYILIERIAIQGPVTNEPPPKPQYSPRVDINELKSPGQATAPNHVNNQQPNITGGYILEWDFRKGADYNITAGGRGYVGIKEPEHDYKRDVKTNEGIRSPEQVSYINGYVDAADAALFGGNFTNDTTGWKKYIDEASAVDYYLAMEYMKPVDGNMWASVYMYKPRGGKLEFGPMWDFDLAAGSATRAGNVASTSGWYLRNSLNISAMQSSTTWFNRLNEDPDFRAAAKARWNEINGTLDFTTFMNTQSSLLAQSAAANYKKWPHSERISSYQVIKSDWDADWSFLKSWANSRESWIDGQL